MPDSAFHPEDKARSAIDRRLATCGRQVQSKADMNLGAALGVAIREFATASGPVDYALFVDKLLRRGGGQAGRHHAHGFFRASCALYCRSPRSPPGRSASAASNTSRPTPKPCFATLPTPSRVPAASSPSTAPRRCGGGCPSRRPCGHGCGTCRRSSPMVFANARSRRSRALERSLAREPSARARPDDHGRGQDLHRLHRLLSRCWPMPA